MNTPDLSVVVIISGLVFAVIVILGSILATRYDNLINRHEERIASVERRLDNIEKSKWEIK